MTVIKPEEMIKSKRKRDHNRDCVVLFEEERTCCPTEVQRVTSVREENRGQGVSSLTLTKRVKNFK
jgi:hypothetical protein